MTANVPEMNIPKWALGEDGSLGDTDVPKLGREQEHLARIACERYEKILELQRGNLELSGENAYLRKQIETLSAPVTDACKKAAVEICNTYEVTAPRGVSFANRPPVTISIIIEQALIAARKESK